MNALEIIQQAAITLGFERPESIQNKQDYSTLRLLGALNRALEEIIKDYDWQNLILPCTFTTTAVDGQGGYYWNDKQNFGGYAIDEVCPSFDYFLTDYLYDHNDTKRIPCVTLDRNQIGYFYNTTLTPSFIFISGTISFNPEIPADHKV
ncbi:hypothetical protein FACS189496_3040 [Bacilli bacterium]|nr:hypothetical protein FACS189496_3040 [Bacilli bacterium]